MGCATTKFMKNDRNTRAQKIGEALDVLFPAPQPQLVYNDPFTLLVAVILSARCRDERVNEVTKVLFAVAPNAAALSHLPLEKLIDLIRPCGLYNAKAHALKATAKIVAEKHNGKVPGTFDALEKLPGVGHKTASVVLGIAFGQPTFPVDTHVFRWARKWRLSDGKNVRQVEADLKKCFPPQLWLKRHLQMILYGRNHKKLPAIFPDA